MIRNAGGDELLELMLGPYHEDTDHPWHRVERGEIPLAEYGVCWSRKPRARGLELPMRTLQQMEPHAAVVERARHLRGDGYRTAVLTNNAREVGDDWRAIVPIDELFDVVVDSCLVGMRKPNPEIYRYTAAELGVTPERCVFLDDAAGNVAGAEEVGMRAILVDLDVAPALAELDKILSGDTV